MDLSNILQFLIAALMAIRQLSLSTKAACDRVGLSVVHGRSPSFAFRTIRLIYKTAEQAGSGWTPNRFSPIPPAWWKCWQSYPCCLTFWLKSVLLLEITISLKEVVWFCSDCFLAWNSYSIGIVNELTLKHHLVDARCYYHSLFASPFSPELLSAPVSREQNVQKWLYHVGGETCTHTYRYTSLEILVPML